MAASSRHIEPLLITGSRAVSAPACVATGQTRTGGATVTVASPAALAAGRIDTVFINVGSVTNVTVVAALCVAHGQTRTGGATVTVAPAAATAHGRVDAAVVVGSGVGPTVVVPPAAASARIGDPGVYGAGSYGDVTYGDVPAVAEVKPVVPTAPKAAGRSDTHKPEVRPSAAPLTAVGRVDTPVIGSTGHVVFAAAAQAAGRVDAPGPTVTVVVSQRLFGDGTFGSLTFGSLAAPSAVGRVDAPIPQVAPQAVVAAATARVDTPSFTGALVVIAPPTRATGVFATPVVPTVIVENTVPATARGRADNPVINHQADQVAVAPAATAAGVAPTAIAQITVAAAALTATGRADPSTVGSVTDFTVTAVRFAAAGRIDQPAIVTVLILAAPATASAHVNPPVTAQELIILAPAATGAGRGMAPDPQVALDVARVIAVARAGGGLVRVGTQFAAVVTIQDLAPTTLATVESGSHQATVDIVTLTP